MNKDLLAEKYGRYYEIPYRLSENGHHVDMLLLAYRKEEDVSSRQSVTFTWRSIARNLLKYVSTARGIAKNNQVDLIVGSADMPFCILAEWIGRRYGIPVISDIYDNFDTYASTKIPFLSVVYYRSLKRIDTNIAFTEILKEYLEAKVPSGHYEVVPNSVDKTLFRPMDGAECRVRLGLPTDKLLVGYFGAIAHSRGIEVVSRAFERLQNEGLNVELVMAGKRDDNVELPRNGMTFLGLLAHDEIPFLINACDVNVICYKDDAFSRYSFPYKAAEYIACQKPFVAPDVGGIVAFLEEHEEYLYKVGDEIDLAKKVKALLEKKDFSFPLVASWDEVASDFSEIIDKTLERFRDKKQPVSKDGN